MAGHQVRICDMQLIYFTRDRGELFWNCSKTITVMTCFEMVGKKNIFLRCCLCFVWFFFCAFPSHETIGLNFQDNFVASWYAHKHRANKASFWQFCFFSWFGWKTNRINVTSQTPVTWLVDLMLICTRKKNEIHCHFGGFRMNAGFFAGFKNKMVRGFSLFTVIFSIQDKFV